MSQHLPPLPNLGHLKKQAKDVLRVSRKRSPRWRLADAQHALARGYGFPSWPDLKRHVESAGPIVRGRSANAAAAEQGKEQMQALIPVDYVVEFEEITVTGDYAFEWGTYRGAARPRAGGSDIIYSGRLMRILQRQPDGSWKMHRTMLTTDPQAP